MSRTSSPLLSCGRCDMHSCLPPHYSSCCTTRPWSSRRQFAGGCRGRSSCGHATPPLSSSARFGVRKRGGSWSSWKSRRARQSTWRSSTQAWRTRLFSCRGRWTIRFGTRTHTQSAIYRISDFSFRFQIFTKSFYFRVIAHHPTDRSLNHETSDAGFEDELIGLTIRNLIRNSINLKSGTIKRKINIMDKIFFAASKI